jgi:hypothetical protein
MHSRLMADCVASKARSAPGAAWPAGSARTARPPGKPLRRDKPQPVSDASQGTAVSQARVFRQAHCKAWNPCGTLNAWPAASQRLPGCVAPAPPRGCLAAGPHGSLSSLLAALASQPARQLPTCCPNVTQMTRHTTYRQQDALGLACCTSCGPSPGESPCEGAGEKRRMEISLVVGRMPSAR